MSDRKIDLKNPWAAGLLAWLVPGAGHWYQRRYFKAAIYSVCILGTFLYGMALGEWRPVHWTEMKGGQRSRKWLSFAAQSGVGTAGVIGYLQSNRAHSPENNPTIINGARLFPTEDADRIPSIPLKKPIDAPFEGRLQGEGQIPTGSLTGRVQIEPQNQSFIGTFDGTVTTDAGEERSIQLKLGVALYVDRPILGSPHRQLKAAVVDDDRFPIAEITGRVPRSAVNWVAAPLDEPTLTELNLRLNKRYEMALVFTWIAGLLNVLAIWDAVQGPAYGFGDEPPPEKDPKDKKGDSEKSDSKETSAAAETPEPDEGETSDEKTHAPETVEAAPASKEK